MSAMAPNAPNSRAPEDVHPVTQPADGLHRPDVEQGKRRIDAAHDVADSRNHRDRARLRADDDAVVARGDEPVREVRRWRRRTALVQFHRADVGHDANHRKPGTRFVAPESESATQRIGAGPEGLGQRAVDECHRRVAAKLFVEKRSTRDEAKTERLEPVTGHARVLDDGLAALLEHAAFNNGRRIRSALIVERHEVGDRRGVRPGQRVECGRDIVDGPDARSGCVVRRAGEIDAHGHQVRRVVAQRHDG